MASPASIGKHPLHPMLVGFPIALWIFSFVCDLVYAFDWGGAIWHEMAFYTMAGGVIGALAAAVPGYIDFRSITDETTQRIGKMAAVYVYLDNDDSGYAVKNALSLRELLG